MITSAQRAAVAALDLPFDLTDADIARQFNADGSDIVRAPRNPMAAARGLARSAMIAQAAANDALAPAKAA